jgi:hypothetical protein
MSDAAVCRYSRAEVLTWTVTVLLRIETLPVLWTTRVRARPFARDAGSVNSSRLFTVTEAEGCQAPSFWQEEKITKAIIKKITFFL